MVDPVTTMLVVQPAVKLTELLMKPLIEKLAKGVSTKSQVAYHYIFNSYTEYLSATFERYSYFTSIVFKNEQKKLEDYYLPLTILKHPGNEETIIDGYPTELLKTVKKLLIVDTAGMGKTTLLKFLFISCVKATAGIPIYIELRKLSKDQSILDFICEQLADLADAEAANKSHLLFKLLNAGEFIFFLDGYDEIPEDQRWFVTSELQQFIQKAPLNKYVMTSREETGLTAFSQFQRFNIKPLQTQEAYALLRKYANNSLSETLINKLELPENKAIHEFLTNPLLTSLLYKSFEFKQVIPLKRHIFYRQVFEALYETHDLTKEGGEYQRKKKSGMDIDKFDLILRSLAIVSYKKDKIEFEKEELLTFIDQAKKLSSENDVASSYILHDLTHAVPLMVEDGNYIRWTHKSIQEYFAAQFICRNMGGNQKKILLDYFHGKEFGKHLNLITLCGDIDQISFKHSIAKELAEALLKQYRSTYNDEFPDIPIDVIENRKCLSAGRHFFILYDVPHSSRFNAIDHKIEKQAATLGIDVEYGFDFILARDAGISEVFTKVSHNIASLQGFGLPFLEVVLREGDYLERIGKRPHKAADVQVVDDTPINPLNQPYIFEVINTVLETRAGWRFNPQKALSFLEEIENESKAQEELMDIFSV